MPHRPYSGPFAPALLLVLALGGCATTPDGTVPDDSPAAAAEGAAEAAPAAAPAPADDVDRTRWRNFSSETLYQLLLAELELRRGDLDSATDRYIAEARITRDPGVVASAARLAMMSRDTDRAAEMALLWSEIAPDDPDALQAAALALIRNGDFDGALQRLSDLRASGSEGHFTYLAVHADEVSPRDRAGLLKALAELQSRWPADKDLAFARAVLLERDEQPAAALEALAPLGAGDYGNDALLLRARLLEETGDAAGAIRWLRDAIARGGDVSRLRYALARMLVDADDLAGAKVQFDALLESVGENPEILLSQALISLQGARLDEAVEYLDRLLRTGRRQDTANLYLGITAQRRGDVDAALQAWSRVRPGFEYTRAQAGAARLALDQGGRSGLRDYLDRQRDMHPDQAVTLWLLEGQTLLDAGRAEPAVDALDVGLDAFPGDQDLLYARAMAHDAAGDLAGLERDLRTLVQAHPDDAMALNALGYTLADRTDRLDEARGFIERALALAPDEPAYVDSLGWLEFRTGDLGRARTLLTQAFAAMHDAEVAAHLGEVMWTQGDRAAARGVWASGLALEQGSELLPETILRLAGQDELDALRKRAAAAPATPATSASGGDTAPGGAVDR